MVFFTPGAEDDQGCGEDEKRLAMTGSLALMGLVAAHGGNMAR
jgi:hypothetical protein